MPTSTAKMMRGSQGSSFQITLYDLPKTSAEDLYKIVRKNGAELTVIIRLGIF